MSSSNPNLTNLPSNSEHGKLIKSCFKPKKGWLMVGADFNALEDRINTLLTKDPNKMKVYTDGYDGHCLRSHYYWKDKMPDIEQATDTDKCYSAIIQDKTIYWKSSDAITYQGTTFNGDAFYEMVTNNQL